MRVLVYNTAAQEGGALFVLKNFYADVVERAPSYIQWHFIVSKDVLQSTENVEVSIFPQVKKSWLHRWYFEKYKLQEIIEKFNPDYIISLQNMPLMHVKRPQLVYLHQSLQYCPKNFLFLKSRRGGWLYVKELLVGYTRGHCLKRCIFLFKQIGLKELR